MLIKEYRIPVPMTVEEYRIAQLYMIAVGDCREVDCGENLFFLGRLAQRNTSIFVFVLVIDQCAEVRVEVNAKRSLLHE